MIFHKLLRIFKFSVCLKLNELKNELFPCCKFHHPGNLIHVQVLQHNEINLDRGEACTAGSPYAINNCINGVDACYEFKFFPINGMQGNIDPIKPRFLEFICYPGQHYSVGCHGDISGNVLPYSLDDFYDVPPQGWFTTSQFDLVNTPPVSSFHHLLDLFRRHEFGVHSSSFHMAEEALEIACGVDLYSHTVYKPVKIIFYHWHYNLI